MKLQCYDDIDELPIHNWFKVVSTGDYSYLLIDRKKVVKSKIAELEKQWKILYDQYIKEFGFSESFLQMFEIKKDIALLQIEKAETGDLVIETFINVKRAELERKQEDISGSDYYETKAYMEGQIGFQIDSRKMSVMEFYKTLKSLEKKPRKQG